METTDEAEPTITRPMTQSRPTIPARTAPGGSSEMVAARPEGDRLFVLATNLGRARMIAIDHQRRGGSMHSDAGRHGNSGLARHVLHQPRGGGLQARLAISVQLHECEVAVDAQSSRGR